MRLLKLILTVSFIGILFQSNSIFGTHIIGGEIYYDCLGSDKYKITLKIYRDCENGQAPYDPYAHISFFNSSVLFCVSSEDAIGFDGVVAEDEDSSVGAEVVDSLPVSFFDDAL